MFVDESKRSSSYLPRIPGPQLQRASLVVRASGGSGQATTESSTKLTKDGSSSSSFEWAIAERSTNTEFVLRHCCLCRSTLKRNSVPQRWKLQVRFPGQDTCIPSNSLLRESIEAVKKVSKLSAKVHDC